MSITLQVTLCSVVDCLGQKCIECPAYQVPYKDQSRTPEQCLYWWKKHWDFERQEPKKPAHNQETNKMSLKLTKFCLCTYVDCRRGYCSLCPANNHRDKKYFPKDAQIWWEQHWDFTQQKMIPKFRRGDTVLVKNNKADRPVMAMFIAKHDMCYEASIHQDPLLTSTWKYCEPAQ